MRNHPLLCMGEVISSQQLPVFEEEERQYQKIYRALEVVNCRDWPESSFNARAHRAGILRVILKYARIAQTREELFNARKPMASTV